MRITHFAFLRIGSIKNRIFASLYIEIRIFDDVLDLNMIFANYLVNRPLKISKRKRPNYICLKDIEDDLIEALINKVHIRTGIWDRNNSAYAKNNHESHRIFDEATMN